MKIAKSENTRIDINRVKTLAYQMWEQAGSPAGRDLEFWLAAEAGMLEEQSGKETAKASSHPIQKAQPSGNLRAVR